MDSEEIKIIQNLNKYRQIIYGFDNYKAHFEYSNKILSEKYSGKQIIVPQFLFSLIELSINYFQMFKDEYPNKQFDFTIYGICVLSVTNAAKNLIKTDLRKLNTSWEQLEVTAIFELINKFGEPRK